MVSPGAILGRHHACGWKRGQQHAARLEHPIRAFKGGSHVVDEVQRLREDEAVVGLERQLLRDTKISDQRRARIPRVDVEDIRMIHPLRAERCRQAAVQHFEHPTMNVGRMLGQEPENVVPIDRESAFASPVPADR